MKCPRSGISTFRGKHGISITRMSHLPLAGTRFEHSVHYCTGLLHFSVRISSDFRFLDRPNVGEMNSRSTCACRARAREKVVPISELVSPGRNNL